MSAPLSWTFALGGICLGLGAGFVSSGLWIKGNPLIISRDFDFHIGVLLPVTFTFGIYVARAVMAILE